MINFLVPLAVVLRVVDCVDHVISDVTMSVCLFYRVREGHKNCPRNVANLLGASERPLATDRQIYQLHRRHRLEAHHNPPLPSGLYVLYFSQSFLSFKMMLSPSAARMGTVSTTLRHIGKSRRGFSIAALGRRESEVNGSGMIRQAFNRSAWDARAVIASDLTRWKSTMAAAYSDSEDDEEEFETLDRSHGHAEAVKARSALSHEEAWMVNLGRDDNNEWLLGPRDADDWFTGLKPSICPGTDQQGVIRSLPLPKLDAVTREAAREYFDNSWTLYETLFAGLNGEEYFYRYVCSCCLGPTAYSKSQFLFLSEFQSSSAWAPPSPNFLLWTYCLPLYQ